MANLNFTKVVSRFLSLPLINTLGLAVNHEKNSSSRLIPLDDFSVKRAFFMLSHDYRFKVVSTLHDLGVCRVELVCVLADLSIELGLLTPDGYVSTYRFDDLVFYHPSDLRLN